MDFLHRAVEFKASALLRRRIYPIHLNLIALDVDSESFFTSLAFSCVRSLDASRIGLNDTDIERLANGQHLNKLNWLSLAGNSVTQRGVDAVCTAIQTGRFNLKYLDLRGTLFDATPYLDGGDGILSHWRVPRAGRLLRETFGHQGWMTCGQNWEDENTTLVSIDNFYPNRFDFYG